MDIFNCHPEAEAIINTVLSFLPKQRAVTNADWAAMRLYDIQLLLWHIDNDASMGPDEIARARETIRHLRRIWQV